MMIDQAQWPLGKIREAYLDIVDLYNALYPLVPEIKTRNDEVPAPTDGEDHSSLYAILPKLKTLTPKLKEAADQSGNAQCWRRGEPLNNLNEGMRRRIERALKFGF